MTIKDSGYLRLIKGTYQCGRLLRFANVKYDFASPVWFISSVVDNARKFVERLCLFPLVRLSLVYPGFVIWRRRVL